MWLELARPVLTEAWRGRGRGGAAAPPAAQLGAPAGQAATPRPAQAQRAEGRNEACLAVAVGRVGVAGQLLQVGRDPVGRGVGPGVAPVEEPAAAAPAQKVAAVGRLAHAAGQLAGHNGRVQGCPVVGKSAAVQAPPIWK